MTLHWWMHWFWVTAQIVVSLTSPTSERPMKSTIIPETTTTMPVVTSISSESYAGQQQQRYSTTETLAKLQQSYRIAKAIGLQPTETAAADAASIESLKQTYTTDSPKNNLHVITTPIPVVTSNVDKLRSTPTPNNGTLLEMYENKTGRIPGKKDTKITWIHGFSKPPKLKYEEKTSTLPSDIDMPDELLTVMPLQDNFSKSHDPNAIHREQQHTNNRSIEEQLLGEETVEPHVIATAASILDANVADSTRLGRARGAFNSEFKVDQLSRENQRNNENNDNESETVKGNTVENGSANVTEIATITGSCLAIIILLSTVGSLGFIMYRRRYLNPPQTLNSDKCSNPDSSGYIDDSTIRDNSEEMYSLDNDSFLNSLEAMTIQNYWTDSVKHTKL